MNRKLMLLNAVLLAVVIYTGAQLRKQWKASKAREKAIPVGVKTLPTPRYQPLDPPPPVIANTYNDIAQKLLFDRSRDSKVIIEPPPPPPPPPPMPPLPVYHGMMNIGAEGPIAILSLGSASNQAVHPGEKIGQFKLLAVNSEEIDFEWNGATIRKSVGELTGAARGIAPVQQSGDGSRTEAPVAAAPPRPVLVGPGEETGRGRACNINDGNATGTVVDGLRKVAYNTPFGQSCLWEPAK